MTTVQRHIGIIVVAVNITANITHHTTNIYTRVKESNSTAELCYDAIKIELYGILLQMDHIV